MQSNETMCQPRKILQNKRVVWGSSIFMETKERMRHISFCGCGWLSSGSKSYNDCKLLNVYSWMWLIVKAKCKAEKSIGNNSTAKANPSDVNQVETTSNKKGSVNMEILQEGSSAIIQLVQNKHLKDEVHKIRMNEGSYGLTWYYQKWWENKQVRTQW